jgi:acetyltransferase
MDKHYLTPLFAPESVAVVGATDRPGSAGRVVFENIVHSGFKGRVYAVNPNRQTVFGRPTLPSLQDIDDPVDLAVIITPAGTVPAIVEAAGRRKIKAAIVVSSGFTDPTGKPLPLMNALVNNARLHNLRLLGPNSLGILRPDIGLHLAYSRTTACPGNIALVSQSGALTNAILDWANANDVGFSSVVSLGDSADVKFGEVLDYLVWDNRTDGILLYVEGIHDRRRFISALRAAARVKPVVVVKTGRDAAGYRAAVTHSGAMVGNDEVFDAVLRRAGAVRVRNIAQILAAARALTAPCRPSGNRLAIVTNGGGPGILAADAATDFGVRIPELSRETLDRLEPLLAANWSRSNPVDLCGEATPAQYRAAVEACLEDRNTDGVLAILTPQAPTNPREVAQAIVDLAAGTRKPVIACWMGEESIRTSREAFARARIPVFRTPEPAVEVFSHLATYLANQRLLMQVPEPSAHEAESPDIEGARILIETALAEKRTVLTEMESKALLSTFRIPVARTMVARSVSEAIVIAEQLGFPVAMKINSREIAHKSDVGGVRLNISTAAEVRGAYTGILHKVAETAPGAQVDGVAIQPMHNKPNGRELMVGVSTDAVFGPVISFGPGGFMVEVMGDRALALPPLNRYLARDMIGRTRICRTLGEFRNMPAVDMAALEDVLLRVSEMVCELPWLRELDINPLIVDERGVVAVDARVVVGLPPLESASRYSHMAIYPYPGHLIRPWQLADGTPVTIRPIRPEDAEMHQNFVRGLSEETKYFRFISTMHELTPKLLVRFTQIDYDREMALLAVTEMDGVEVELGVARYVINPDADSCEFALVVGDEWHGKGIGSKLMISLMDVAREKGLRTIEGDVLANNHNMLKLMAALGFAVTANEEDPALKRVVKTL